MHEVGFRLARVREDERGYTLQEVLTAVAILGVLLAIAIFIFLALLERWRVEAAAEQLAADMRRAHTSATSQLTDWRLIYNVGGPEYYLVGLAEVCPNSATAPCVNPPARRVIPRELPDGTKIKCSSNGPDPAPNARFVIPNLGAGVYEAGRSRTVEFNSDGTMSQQPGPAAGLEVSSTSNEAVRLKLTVLAATSRVAIRDAGCT